MIIFIQARMSSRRLPGKVLKNIDCYPILTWTIKRLRFLNGPKIAIITSKEPSDDPIIEYCKNQKVDCFRGSLNNVLLRFKKACEYFSEENFIRICADSPFIDWKLIKIAISKYQENSFDIVTNVLKRSFPKGQSVEILNLNLLNNLIMNSNIGSDHLEHVTKFIYENPNHFNINSFEHSHRRFKNIQLSIDTLEDFKKASLIAKKEKNLINLSWEEITELFINYDILQK